VKQYPGEPVCYRLIHASGIPILFGSYLYSVAESYSSVVSEIILNYTSEVHFFSSSGFA
jgi:hypothetical protein